MSAVPSYFKDFLSNIRLSDNQVSDLKTGHTTLRKRLETDETLSKIIVSTFLQGSYRRSTAVKPKNGNKSDVDVIVVTKLDSEEYTPEEALDLFVPFLDKYYKGKYRIQGRSIGISLSYVDLDIVPTSAPSESETGILVRSGVYSLTIIDSDIFEVGNLSRHVLNVDDIGGLKGLSLCNYLNSLNPHANVEVINNALTIDRELKANINLDKYGIIIDCTGENSVLDIIQSNNFKKRHIFASVSVGLGAKRLYITLMNNQTFDFKAFFDLIAPYLQSEGVLYNDYDLPRNGIGCWHPTFPGRSDDVWLAASTATKAIENYIITESEKTISLVYEQRESNGFFEGYMLVDKTEDG